MDMKHWLGILILAATVGWFPLATGAKAPSVDVLFVGNSIFNRNDLPAVFEHYVSSAYPDVDLRVAMVATDGATFAKHNADGAAAKQLDSADWDFVVLQGGYDAAPTFTFNGERKFLPPTQYVENGAVLCMKARERGGRTVVFETSTFDPNTAPYIQYAAKQLATRCNGKVAPVGTVERNLGSAWPSRLLADDRVHPSKTGTLVGAITVAEAIFGAPSEGKGFPDSGAHLITNEEIEAIRVGARMASANLMAASDSATQPPPFASDPGHQATQSAAGERISGTWRARMDIFRLSLGSEFAVSWQGGEPHIDLVNYQVGGVVRLPMQNIERNAETLSFKTKIAGVVYDVSLQMSGSELKALGSYSSNEVTKIYSEKFYRARSDPEYFSSLQAIYRRLETEEKANGLAAALPSHFVALENFLGKEQLARVHQNFPISEWDAIMVGDAYKEGGRPERALDYYAAAVTLYPKSVDALIYLGQSQAAAGRHSAAKSTFLKAMALNAGSSRVKDELLRRSLAELTR